MTNPFTPPPGGSDSASAPAIAARFISSAGRPAAISAITFATTCATTTRVPASATSAASVRAAASVPAAASSSDSIRAAASASAGPGGPRGRGRGGRGRGKRGDVRAAILKLLAERPMHGYEMIQEIAERSQNLWRPSPGSVYPTLQLLVDEGLLVATRK